MGTFPYSLSAVVLGSGRKKRTSTKAAAGAHGADGDREEDSEGSTASETEAEDEFAQWHDGNHAENLNWAELENRAPRNRDWEDTINIHGKRLGTRGRNSRLSSSGCSEPTDTPGAEENNSQQIEKDSSSTSRVEEEHRGNCGAKRKAKTAARNRARNNKFARKEKPVGYNHNHKELQLLVGEGELSQDNNGGAVPWEHRGLLGQTRGGREGINCQL